MWTARPCRRERCAPISVPELAAGSAQTLVSVNVADSATGGQNDAISTEAAPRMLPPSGLWCGRLSQVGQTDWFNFPVRGKRTFTVVTEALDETGHPSNFKAMPVLGIWDAFAPGAPPVGAAPGLNGNSTGESWLQIDHPGRRCRAAGHRGPARRRPARLRLQRLGALRRSVEPERLPASGGPIAIRGMGFHVVDTVLVGGMPAQVMTISPNEITAIAPPAAAGVTGSVDVEVDDLPVYYAIAVVSGGLSYDAGNGDALTLVTAPANTVPIGVPLPFTVTALGPALSPAGGVSVTYTVSQRQRHPELRQASCQVTSPATVPPP